MGKYKELAKNTVIISVGTMLSKIVSFLMTRFYTGVLTPAEYGTSDLLNSTVSLLMPVISLGIADGVYRYLPEYPRSKKSDFSIGVYMVTAGTQLLAVFLPILRLEDGFDGYLPLLVFITLAACYHSVCEQYVRASGDTMLFAKQGLMNTMLVVTLNIVLLKVFSLGVTGYMLAVGLSDCICTAYLIIKKRLWGNLTVHPNKHMLKKMLRYSIPLIPTTVFWWITSVSDRYMIAAILGSEANGIYTVANKLPTMLTLLSGVLMQAWQYSAVSESKSSLEEQADFYSNVWIGLLSAMFFACSGMIAFAKVEVSILAAPEYYEAWRCVPILCAAMLFCAFTSFMGSVYTVTQKSTLSLWTSLLGAVINVIMNALLIPSPMGIYGAAFATWVSYFVVFLVRSVNARKYIPFRLFGKVLFISTALLAVQILFMCFEWTGWIAVQAGVVVLMFLIGRKQIMEKINAFRRRSGGKKA